MVRTYTDAPEAYDGFGTVTVQDQVGRTNRGLVRLVETPDEHAEWQRARYESGSYLAWDDQRFAEDQAGKFPLVEPVVPEPGEQALDLQTLVARKQAGESWETLAREVGLPVTTLRGRVKRFKGGKPARPHRQDAATAPATPEPATGKPHLLLLPPNLAALARLTAKDNPRYTMNSVRLSATETGYRAMATNGRVAGIVFGPFPADPEEYPPIPALNAAPNSGTDALVPAKDWAEVFKLIPKSNCGAKPALQNLAAVIGPNEVNFGATDMERARSLMVRKLDGKFPNVDEVIPSGPPQATIDVDPFILADLLQVAAQYTSEDNRRVTLELHGASPMVVKCKNGEQTFTSAIMPLKAAEVRLTGRKAGEIRLVAERGLSNEEAGADVLRKALAEILEIVGVGHENVPAQGGKTGEVVSEGIGG